jgi:hypothetical protein
MDDFASLLALVPPQYLVYVLLVLKSYALINVVSTHLSALLKWLLGKPRTPETGLRAAAFAFVKLLDWAALNTRKPADAATIANLEKRVGEQDRKLFAQRTTIGNHLDTINKQDRVIDTHESTIARQTVNLQKVLGIKGKS